MVEIIHDNPGVAALVIGALLVFVTMFISWWRVGRDPKPGFVIPRAEPPRGLSPTELSWIYGRGHKGNFQGRSIAAATISLGLRGKLTIREGRGTIQLVRRDSENALPDEDLPPGERALIDRLLGSQSAITIGPGKRSVVRHAIADLEHAIAAALPNTYFARNWPPTIVGFAMAILTLVLFFALSPPNDDLMVVIALFFGAGLLIGMAVANTWARLSGNAPQIPWANILLMLVSAGVLLMVVYVLISTWAMFGAWESLLSGLSATVMGTTVAGFAVLMSRPTTEGREILDEVEGFRHYMSAGGTERLKMLGVPPVTEQLFERLLPYAVALGVAWPWSQAFEKHLDETDPEARSLYRFGFYSGTSVKSGEIAQSTVNIAARIREAYEKAAHRQ